MKLACGDHAFPMLEHELALDLIAGLGFEGVDLLVAGDRSHVRPEDIRPHLTDAATTIRSRIAARGLSLSDVFCIPRLGLESLAPNHPDAEEFAASRALFNDMFEFVMRIDAPGMTMLPGVVFDSIGHDASLERAAEELQWRAVRLASEDKRFSVECHTGSVAPTPRDALELLRRAPDLQITLDYSHFIAQGHGQHEVDQLVSRTGHVQVRGAAPGRGQAGWRDNTIDFEAIVDRLQSVSYDDFLSLEYVWTEWGQMNTCDNVSETVLLRDRLMAKLSGIPWTYSGPPV